MSAAGWFIVLLALVGANLPFLNQRLFAAVPLKAVKKSAWIRIAELIVLYFVVGAFGFLLDEQGVGLGKLHLELFLSLGKIMQLSMHSCQVCCPGIQVSTLNF